ncbi:MAG: 4Fe-4S binding protein [Arcobacter butzleri]|nr:4Fe-4S binding protein [Aliarcobacter butzleri]
MVTFVKRDKNDIFDKTILGFLFKNPKFLLILRIFVSLLFFYAIYYGLSYPNKDNLFTIALFWGIFWPLFMLLTLPSFGRIFCGICPHGFLGKYISKIGLKKSMPDFLQNRYIGIFLLLFGWWGVYYSFDGFWKSPFATALLFLIMTITAFLFYFLYKEMSYCKYICPIGTVSRAFDKLSFTKLETYKSACKDCTTFECASSCHYGLKPFTFEKKNSIDDCTLCMECANSCESVKFIFTKPSNKLLKYFKPLNAEIWTYIVILAAIPISMSFAHALNKSQISSSFIWNQHATMLGLGEFSGSFAFIYALILTLFFAIFGIFVASKVLKNSFSNTFSNLGYAYAPLFILGSLGHALEMFFIKDYQLIIEGFLQVFNIKGIDIKPLATKKDSWLLYLSLLKWIGVIWSFILLKARIKIINSTKIRKIIAYIFASSLILFFIAINIYKSYIINKYPIEKSTTFSYTPKKTVINNIVKLENIDHKEPLFFAMDTNYSRNYENLNSNHNSSKNNHHSACKTAFVAYGDINSYNIVQGNLSAYYYDTDQKVKQLRFDNKNNSFMFEVPLNGYYTLFAINESIFDNKYYYKIAKKEYLHALHGKDEKYSQKDRELLFAKEPKIDLIRYKNKDENSYFYKNYYGEKLLFKALLEGKSLSNAKVKVSLESGWEKTFLTDKDGFVSFEIIKDYFPTKSQFDKRYMQNLLITLTYQKESLSNNYEKEEYILTYPMSFYPNEDDYKSFAFSIVLITILSVFGVFLVINYRKKGNYDLKELKNV